jgi:putative transposase
MSRDFDKRYPRFAIGAHDRITIDGAAFRFVGQGGDAWHLSPADGVGLCETFTYEKLNELSSEGRVVHEVDHFLPAALRPQPKRSELLMADLTPEQSARLVVRDAFVQAFGELYRAGLVKKTEPSVTQNVDAICAAAEPYLADTVDLVQIDRDAEAKAGKGRKSMGGKLAARITPVHPSTILRWVRAESRDGKAGLADSVERRGNRTSRLSLEQRIHLATCVNRRWMDRNRPTQATVVRDVQDDFRAENAKRIEAGLPPMPIPGRQVIRRQIRSIHPFFADIARLGIDEAKKRHRPIGAGLEILHPFERVEMDEQKIDLITMLTAVGLMPLFTTEELELLGLTNKKGRWWICMAVDCRTKVIAGLTLTNEPKSSAAARCLRMVVSDKGWLADAAGSGSRWDQYASVELLVTDNGSFKEHGFTHRVGDLGTNIERTIAGAPSMRGHIERVFATLGQGLLPRLAGRTFGDVIERGDHPSEKRACLGPEDLCYALVRWIVDIYHNTPHEGLGGRTPLEQWEIDRRDGNYPLRAAPDARRKRLAFGVNLSRRAGREGVTILGVRYQSQALAEFVLKRGNVFVDIRWDEEDIGAIEVRMDGGWISVGAVDPTLKGQSTRVWVAARRALRTRDPQRISWEQDVVRKAIVDISAMNTHRMLQFGLIERSMSVAELERLEESLFDGFRVVPTKPKTRPSDGPGRSIVPLAPDAEPASLPTAVDDDPTPASDNDVSPTTPRRSEDDDWSFETEE